MLTRYDVILTRPATGEQSTHPATGEQSNPSVSKNREPFLDGFPELIKLDNRNCVNESVVIALYALEDRVIEQYPDFVRNVLENCT